MVNATIPPHLPRRLTISLWDFSWYTQTMPDEPFDDLDLAFGEAVERGYNAQMRNWVFVTVETGEGITG
jgi:hypothetical protein